MLSWLFGIVFGVLLLLLVLRVLVFIARLLLSFVGLGLWACRKDWHWWREFLVHSRIEFPNRATYYLAAGGQRIRQCRTCQTVNPPAGREVLAEYRAGELVVTETRLPGFLGVLAGTRIGIAKKRPPPQH